MTAYPGADSQDSACNGAGLVAIDRYDDEFSSFDWIRSIFYTKPFQMLGLALTLSDNSYVLALVSGAIVEVFEFNKISGKWEKQKSFGKGVGMGWETSLANDVKGTLTAAGSLEEDK